uniref:Uncharacterized protein n=1 Tax=Meloidogyne enterolobii TaxID=390850 RepID=A0A6V7UVV0_MELEN|nr:unnamed protein product [Meloidogyne enterolobii]
MAGEADPSKGKVVQSAGELFKVREELFKVRGSCPVNGGIGPTTGEVPVIETTYNIFGTTSPAIIIKIFAAVNWARGKLGSR